MPARAADAVILRSHPLRESDRIVSFYTRQFGKCRGVAHRARGQRSPFRAALEPLTEARIAFFERPNQELVTIDRCDVTASMLEIHAAGYEHALALGYIAEIAEKTLPEREPNDAIFRLLAAVLAALRGGAPPWLAVLYDLYWMIRLEGFLPDFTRCARCGREFPDAEAAFAPLAEPGLCCAACRQGAAPRLSAEGRAWTRVFAKLPVEKIPPQGWENPAQAADLRRALHQRLEAHLEQPVLSWKLMQAVS